jgi:hypothetical protein
LLEGVTKKEQLREPTTGISSNVRISNKEGDRDIDKIISKLIKNRFFHADHDPVLSEKGMRDCIKGFLFQDSDL